MGLRRTQIARLPENLSAERMRAHVVRACVLCASLQQNVSLSTLPSTVVSRAFLFAFAGTGTRAGAGGSSTLLPMWSARLGTRLSEAIVGREVMTPAWHTG